MTDDQSIVTAGGWCAPSSALYDLDAADAGRRTFLSFFTPATCPATHPDSDAEQSHAVPHPPASTVTTSPTPPTSTPPQADAEHAADPAAKPAKPATPNAPPPQPRT